jgi:formylglycine-generating enzyme required for sulfatase activity
LSKATGREYRLPSEAEWEYACRAGTTTPFHFGETITTDLANYNGNYTYGSGSKGQYRKQTTDVGSFPANAFGLHDMHGNVWEWCQDTWHENYNGAPTDGSAWVDENANQNRMILRGGSWYNNPRTAVLRIAQLRCGRQGLQPRFSGCLCCGEDFLALYTFPLLPFALFSLPLFRAQREQFF